MKALYLISIIFLLGIKGLAQVDYDKKSVGESCRIDTTTPHFPGGDGEMVKFIDKNMFIPDSIRNSTKTSRVFIDLDIDATGIIRKIKIVHGINSYIDNEVLRVFNLMPNWIPGVENGKKIEKEFIFPIKFNFDKSK